ncbi:MAG: hypothetical protein IJ497_12140 [Clostridia bacterium]|nr:hypothetical protein [Clostridia bacterium]
MRKFSEKHAQGLLISLCAALTVILGLCGWIWLDLRGDENRERMYETEADTAAHKLMDSLDAGDTILAYHYAQLVRDNAAKAGEREAAHTFAGLSETIRITGITEDIRAAAEKYLSGGTEPDKDESSVIPETPYEPEDVAVIRQNDALAAAEEIMGVTGFLTRAVRCRAGEFLFTCRNAYAVIDEKTSLPVEIGISLPPSEDNRLTPEECEARADEFLRKYFPAASQVTASRVYPGDDGTLTVEYRIDGRIVTASVRRDSGKIIRYIAR